MTRPLNSRAFAYAEPGEPSSVLKAVDCERPELHRGQIGLSHKLSSINPADINLIEGKYPAKPVKQVLSGQASSEAEPEAKETAAAVIVPGNEGLATVESLPWGEAGSFERGDWVIFCKPQHGTWRSRSIVSEEDVIKLERNPEAAHPLTEVQAAQLYVNPATAYRMLKDFVDLQPGDWVIQNGANSAVGVNVVQLAKAWGLKTVNVVRDRPKEQLDALKAQLRRLGASEVVTESDLKETSFKEKLKDWTGNNLPKLALNCVSGPTTIEMLKHLAHSGTVVTYGGMSKKPLSVPSGFLIFKDFKAAGFWLSNWYKQASRDERDSMLQELVQLMEKGKLQAPEVELVSVGEQACDVAEAERRLKDAIERTQCVSLHCDWLVLDLFP